MTVLSLFDGISCARVALDRLGYRDILYLASEVDKYAIQIAQKNYPDTIQLGDVCKIQRDMLPQHIDLLIGGSPCQDLSIAKNNRKGLDGERSGLFWEWVRLWKECQPTYWVLENVNSMPKEARRIISETLGVEPIMINAALVSAQNRKRLFWTNIATDVFGNCHIPQPEDRGILLKHILESGTAQDEINKSYCIDANHYKGGKKDTHNQSGKRLMVIEAVGIIQTGHGYNSGGIKAADGKTPPLTISAWEHNNKLIIPETTKQGYTIRKLTPIECERLQSLDDNYTEGISNTQRHKCLGNAFNAEVVRHILSYMEQL
jgi:DNA-cytosine methyltransferase